MTKQKTRVSKEIKLKEISLAPTKSTRGKKKPYSVTMDRFVIAVKDTGGILTNIAEKLHVDRHVIYDFLEREPKAKEYLQQEKEKIIDLGEDSLFSQVKRGEQWATKFLLTTVGKTRGYAETAPVIVNNTALTSVEQLAALYKEATKDEKTTQ